jgi:hypothetical protein
VITILVEGPGDKLALPALIHRLQPDVKVQCIDMKGKSNIIRQNRGFEDTIRRQQALGKNRFIILIDGDVTSAPYQSLAEERNDLPRRAQVVAQELQVTVQVFWAIVCMESWLIGGLNSSNPYCGLKVIPRIPTNTETTPANPKQWLIDRLQHNQYLPRTQECLAVRIDITEARRRNQSMSHFFATIEQES